MKKCLVWLVVIGLMGQGALSWSQGLHGTHVPGFDSAQVLAKEAWPRFNAVYLAPTQLAFNKQWLKDRGQKISSAEREKLQAEYTQLMDKNLRERLSKSGWQLQPKPGPGTLSLSARISDFFLNAPDVEPTISKSYVRVAGFARVEFTLAQTDGEVLAQLTDYSETHEKPGGQLGLTNRGLNRWDFGHLMQRWSTRLTEFLPEPAKT